eukprot:171995_1
MNEKRSHHSCVVDSTTNILYVIGGYDSQNCTGLICDWHTSIETIETNNITQEIWTHFGNLQMPSHGAKSVWYGNKIFVFSGKYDCCSYTDIMHIINTIDGTISTESFPTTRARGGVAVIIVSNILYAFGGVHTYMQGPTFNYDTWDYYNLTGMSSNPYQFTYNPTNLPSASPTPQPVITIKVKNAAQNGAYWCAFNIYPSTEGGTLEDTTVQIQSATEDHWYTLTITSWDAYELTGVATALVLPLSVNLTRFDSVIYVPNLVTDFVSGSIFDTQQTFYYGTTTQPSSSPTSQTSISTQLPTKYPTTSPANDPSHSPTLPNPHSCGTRKWCWNIDIWP